MGICGIFILGRIVGFIGFRIFSSRGDFVFRVLEEIF